MVFSECGIEIGLCMDGLVRIVNASVFEDGDGSLDFIVFYL